MFLDERLITNTNTKELSKPSIGGSMSDGGAPVIAITQSPPLNWGRSNLGCAGEVWDAMNHANYIGNHRQDLSFQFFPATKWIYIHVLKLWSCGRPNGRCVWIKLPSWGWCRVSIWRLGCRDLPRLERSKPRLFKSWVCHRCLGQEDWKWYTNEHLCNSSQNQTHQLHKVNHIWL